MHCGFLQTIDPQERGGMSGSLLVRMKKLGKGRICLTQPISQWLLLIQWTVVVWDIWSMKTFNAARIDIQINGTSVHPGTAYGRLVNALKIANQIDAALPQAEVPEKNKDYQGFYLLHNLSGHIGQAELSYIIRDHDQTLFQKRKEKMVQIIEKLNEYLW